MRTTAVVVSRKSRRIHLSNDIRQQNARMLRHLDSQLPLTSLSRYSSLVNYAPLADEPVHRWFPYREGYSTKLVSDLIGCRPKTTTVFDPFCGCGTTLVAAQSLGLQAYGLDVNPLAVLVTRAKTEHYSHNDLNQLKAYIDELPSTTLSTYVTPKPALRIIDRVFHPQVLRSLLLARDFINSVLDPRLRNFLLTGWLAIIESVSNVYKEGNGIKYRNRKRTPKGYIPIPLSEWQKATLPSDKPHFVLTKLQAHLNLMLDDAKRRAGNKVGHANVIEGSATAMDAIPRDAIDLCVFSPPYCNCFNYFKAFKIELWMGGFVQSYLDMRSLNSRGLRSHVETRLRATSDEHIDCVEQFVSLIQPSQLWDRRIPLAVRGYFADMRRVFRKLRDVLRPQATCVIVVGNSAYGGILIPTDSLLAKIASSLGFTVESIGVARHLTTSSQQKLLLDDRRAFLRESLVILKNTP